MNTILLFFLAFIFVAVLPIAIIFALKNNHKALKIAFIIYSILYFVALFIGTTAEIDISLKTTTINFNYLGKWFDISFLVFDFDLDNIIINLSMFLPLGFIVYVFANKNHFSKTIIFAFCLSLFIEFYQFVLPIYRFTELTDIAFNIISGLISAIISKYLFQTKTINQQKSTR